MSRIAVFYHVYQHDGWLNLFREQQSKLMFSRLGWKADLVHIGINGSEPLTIPLANFKIRKNPNPQNEETDTLKSLLSYAEENPDSKILYLHTKGVTHNTPEVQDWRMMMEYFCVERWEDCVALLDEHDAVGCNFQDHCYYGYFPHFSGNFWWANASHIQSLDHSYLDSDFRHHREFWIGSNGGDLYEIHNSGLENHNFERYPEERYRKENLEQSI